MSAASRPPRTSATNPWSANASGCVYAPGSMTISVAAGLAHLGRAATVRMRAGTVGVEGVEGVDEHAAVRRASATRATAAILRVSSGLGFVADRFDVVSIWTNH